MKGNNHGLSHTINKIMSVFFGIIVVCFSSYNTFALLNHTSGNVLLATLGLILFEGGLIYWWYSFQHGADGLAQMSIALIVFGLCLLAVGLANAIELGAIKLSLDSALPNQLIAVATLVHLVAKMVYPLVSPDTFQRIKTRILEGKLMQKANVMLDDKMDNLAEDIANKMSDNARDALLLSIGHTSGQKIQPIQPSQTSKQVASPVATQSAEIIEGGDFLE